MKYLLLLMALSMTACSHESRLFICANPEMLLQSVQIDPSRPGVKVHPDTIEIDTGDGNRIYLPRVLCMEVVSAVRN